MEMLLYNTLLISWATPMTDFWPFTMGIQSTLRLTNPSSSFTSWFIHDDKSPMLRIYRKRKYSIQKFKFNLWNKLWDARDIQSCCNTLQRNTDIVEMNLRRNKKKYHWFNYCYRTFNILWKYQKLITKNQNKKIHFQWVLDF